MGSMKRNGFSSVTYMTFLNSFFQVLPSTAGTKRKVEEPTKGKKPDSKKGTGPKRR